MTSKLKAKEYGFCKCRSKNELAQMYLSQMKIFALTYELCFELGSNLDSFE